MNTSPLEAIHESSVSTNEPSVNNAHVNITAENQAPVKQPLTVSQDNNKNISADYICVLSQLIFCEPVVLSDGFTYELEYAKTLLASENPISPNTRAPLDKNIIIPNHHASKLTQQFLQQHPDFKQNVYVPNPIRRLIEKSLSSSDPLFAEHLRTTIETNPNALSEIDLSDLNMYLKTAYNNQKFYVFFALLNQFPELEKTGLELCTQKIDINDQDYCNIFYILAEQKKLPIEFFDMTVKFLGTDKCKSLFQQKNENEFNIFQTFWLSHHFEVAKKVLDFFNNDEQDQMINAECEETIVEEDQAEDDSEHSYKIIIYGILHSLLEEFPDADISETLALLKERCPQSIEQILLKPLTYHDKNTTISLLELCLANNNIDNVNKLAEHCSQQTINDAILKPHQEQKQRVELRNRSELNISNTTIRYTNQIHSAYCNDNNAKALAYFKLLKDHAAQAIFCTWHESHKEYCNGIHYLIAKNKIDFCKQILDEKILTPEQFSTALLAKNRWNVTIFSIALESNELAPLQYCATQLGIEQSSQLIFEAQAHVKREVNLKLTTIQVAIRLNKHADIISFLITTVGEKIHELLKLPVSYEPIYSTLSYSNQNLIDLLINSFSDIDLMILAVENLYTTAFKIDYTKYTIILQVIEKRILALIKQQPSVTFDMFKLARFAIMHCLVEVFDYCISSNNKDKIIDIFSQTHVSDNVTKAYIKLTEGQYNILTLAVAGTAFCKDKSLLTLCMTNLNKIINLMSQHAIKSIQLPYKQKFDFMSILIRAMNSDLNQLIINIFDDIAYLQKIYDHIEKSYPESDGGKLLLNAIKNRINQLETQKTPPLTHSETVSADQSMNEESKSNKRDSTTLLLAQSLQTTLNSNIEGTIEKRQKIENTETALPSENKKAASEPSFQIR